MGHLDRKYAKNCKRNSGNKPGRRMRAGLQLSLKYPLNTGEVSSLTASTILKGVLSVFFFDDPSHDFLSREDLKLKIKSLLS